MSDFLPCPHCYDEGRITLIGIVKGGKQVFDTVSCSCGVNMPIDKWNDRVRITEKPNDA